MITSSHITSIQDPCHCQFFRYNQLKLMLSDGPALDIMFWLCVNFFREVLIQLNECFQVVLLLTPQLQIRLNHFQFPQITVKFSLLEKRLTNNLCFSFSRQNCIVTVFIGHQCKHRWFHYSIPVTLCNQHLPRNDMLEQKTCLLPVEMIVLEITVCCFIISLCVVTAQQHCTLYHPKLL